MGVAPGAASNVWLNVIVTAVLGLSLLGLGRWVRRRFAELVPPSLDEPERVRRAAVLRRGGITCQAVGWLFLALAVLSGVM